MPKRHISVQKQPPHPYRIEWDPLHLPAEFPFVCGRVTVQGDNPITMLHVHDCLEVGYCFDGRGVFVIEDKVFPFSAGDVSVINNHEMHLAQSVPGTVSHWTWLIMDPVRLVGFLPQGDSEALRFDSLCGPKFVNLMTARDQPEIIAVTRQLIEESTHQRPGYQTAIRALVWQLMVLLHRLPAGGHRTARNAQERKVFQAAARANLGRIGAALEHLARHCAEPIAIPALAALCHTSVTNFRRLFRQATGLSPHQYLTHLRLQMASTLLAGTDRKILDISQAVGYETLSSFNRHFLHAFGMAPRQWRQGRVAPSK